MNDLTAVANHTGRMDYLPNYSYRSLEVLCRRQACQTGNPKAKRELETMAREYMQLAELAERTRRENEQSRPMADLNRIGDGDGKRG
ncbi:hypothetical protein [Bradyrhizobium sp. USDA 223]|uniref:hypothetical protein n=1 Tax=Bradyrhizobium sp. USDA 223 TaxID=3156306 RepID=UPI00384C0A39